MAFSDFKTLEAVQKLYNIELRTDKLLIPQELSLNAEVVQNLAFAFAYIDTLVSETARCEFIVAPLLFTVYKNHYEKYSFWSHKSIFYDNVLQGKPDYIFSKRSKLGKTVLETPIVAIVEAKKDDFEYGWGQCLAALVAAQKINNNEQLAVYGIVTNGLVWQFGRLIATTFTQEPANFIIDNLNSLYGTLESLFCSIEQDFNIS